MADKDIRRKTLGKARRIVIKVGSSILASVEKGLHHEVFSHLAKEISNLKHKGYEVILVVDATIGFKPGGKEADGSDAGDAAEEPVRLRITPEEAKFLKSLKISVDQDA